MIRQEKASQFEQIASVIEKAFANEEMSDHKEHLLVGKLRQDPAYIPELALVYLENNEVIGHIFYSEAFIGDHPVLALAPVSVSPEHQGKGIGTQLIEASLERAKWSGFSAIVLLGHAQFYPRFGFEKASQYNISAPFDVPDENFMVLPLYKGSLQGIEGTVQYAPPFREGE